MTSPKIPIACPRFSIGKPVKRTFINSGIMIAEPDACIMRAPSRSGKMCACPAIIVPSENSVIAVKNSWRVENFWTRNAEVGIMIPLTSIYPVVNHWAVLA